jgi:hypothetical protein
MDDLEREMMDVLKSLRKIEMISTFRLGHHDVYGWSIVAADGQVVHDSGSTIGPILTEPPF